MVPTRSAPSCPCSCNVSNAEQRRLLWHRYLREHPLNPRQIEKVMGLPVAEQQRLEEEALALLRQAKRECEAL